MRAVRGNETPLTPGLAPRLVFTDVQPVGVAVEIVPSSSKLKLFTVIGPPVGTAAVVKFQALDPEMPGKSLLARFWVFPGNRQKP